jgi:hypothetical protein
MTTIKTTIAGLLRKLADKISPPATLKVVVGGGGGPMEPP